MTAELIRFNYKTSSAHISRIQIIKSEVYEGEVAQVNMVPELVGRFDGVIDGLRSLVDVARGSVGGVRSDVFEEVKERFAHPSVCVHHEPGKEI